MSDLSLGGVSLGPVQKHKLRFAGLLWGDPGCGKTTFAATAPGRKLLINFDPGGTSSIADRDDVDVLDMSDQKAATLIPKLNGDDPLKVGKFLADHEEYESVIIDSVTTLAELCLQYAVSKNQSSTLERPGQHGYAYRNGVLRSILYGFVLQTAIYNRHIVMIAHEGAAVRDAEGSVVKITTSLGESLTKDVTIKLSEIWAMYDTGKERRIALRNVRLRSPCKTRIMDASTKPEFVLDYDPEDDTGVTIASLWNDWIKAGAKIAVP